MGLFRLLLAISVVVAHSSPLFGLRLTGGMIAVQAFYMVSGFYMSLILNEKYGPGVAGTRLFYSNRLLRIFPTYWAVLLAAVAVSLLELVVPRAHTIGALAHFESDFKALGLDEKLFLVVTNVSLFGMDWGNFLRVDAGHLQWASHAFAYHPAAFEFDFVPQAWTLGVELAVYLIAPFVFRRRLGVLFAFAVLSCAARAYAFRLGLKDDPWGYRFFPFEFALFVAGAMAYRAYQALALFRHRLVGWSCLVLAVGLVLAYPALPTGPSILPGFRSGQLLFLAAVFICIPALFHLTKSSQGDRWLGELSYPVYLTHLIVIPLCNGSFGPGNIYPVLGALLVSLVVVLAIERPLDRYRQGRVRSRSKNRDQDAAAVRSGLPAVAME